MIKNESGYADLVTIGEPLGSLASSEYGPLAHTRSLRLRTAGAEANVAIGVRRLGLETLWAGRVGVDPVGDLIIRELTAEGVTVHAVRDQAPTALMLKERRTSEQTRVYYWRDGSAGAGLSEADIPAAAIASAGVLHLTGITAALGTAPRRAMWSAIEIARANGVPVSFDINFRSRLWTHAEAAPVIRDLVTHSDILFAGEQEAALLSDATGTAAIHELSRLGPSTVLLKRGGDGSSALVDDQLVEAPGVPVRVVDAVGAGDAYASGYLAGILKGWSATERLRVAAELGSISVSTEGDWEGLPRVEEIASLHEVDSVQR